MMKQEYGLQELADLTNSINEYMKLSSYLPQIGKNEELSKFCNSENEKWYNSTKLQEWPKINVHSVYQLWGSTSCGWGGMGGSAMTGKHNIVIENVFHGAYYVYWDGRLAYIIKNAGWVKLSNLFYYNEVPKDLLITKGRR